jgi:hypothetical protein
MSDKVVVRDLEELRRLVYDTIQRLGPNCDLNFIDVSPMVEMTGLFTCPNHTFNGDISQWDVSNVINMDEMFSGSDFNGDISRWDVANVDSMYGMFKYSAFNGDISEWNVSNVQCMSNMFEGSVFNGDLSKWDVSRVNRMDDMFRYSKFNWDISNWDVGMCRSFGGMFYRSAFCGDLERWNLVNPELMTFDMLECSLLDWNNCLPQWYKVIYRNQNVVEDFNELDSIDDDEDKNLPF